MDLNTDLASTSDDSNIVRNIGNITPSTSTCYPLQLNNSKMLIYSVNNFVSPFRAPLSPGTESNDSIVTILSESLSSSVEYSSISMNSSPEPIASKADKMLEYKYRSHASVQKKKSTEQTIWCVEFNKFLKPSETPMFAAAYGRMISIFRCPTEGQIKYVSCYEDPDVDEKFYTCCWSMDKDGKHSVLIAGGVRGVIRLIYPENETTKVEHFIGHGGEINQVTVSILKPFLLASASSDRSVRLWNIHTHVCIANIHSMGAHRDGVCTVAFNPKCTKLASGGLDHKIVIWSLESHEIATAIDDSQNFNEKKRKRAFKTITHPRSLFSTRDVHENYIDCIAWFGEFLFSKACKREPMKAWIPETQESRRNKHSSVFELREFDLPNNEYYFMRFAMDHNMNVLGAGGITGTLRVWYLKEKEPEDMRHLDLTHPKCNGVIRDVSFSRCGRIVIFCEGRCIWRWDRT